MRPEFVLELGEVAAFVHEPQHPAENGREAVRQRVHGAEVEHAQPPVGQQAEIARMRIRVQEPDPRRTENRKRISMMPPRVPLSGRTTGDDPGERDAVEPFADQHVVADADHTRDADVRVVGVETGESLLGGSSGGNRVPRPPCPAARRAAARRPGQA